MAGINVGSAISASTEDEDDGWDEKESYLNALVSRGPYNSEPIDPQTLPTDRKERLRAVEDALMTAERTRATSVAWSKLRWIVETSAALPGRSLASR